MYHYHKYLSSAKFCFFFSKLFTASLILILYFARKIYDMIQRYISQIKTEILHVNGRSKYGMGRKCSMNIEMRNAYKVQSKNAERERLL